MFKLRLWRWGGYAGISGEPNVIKRVLVRGKPKGQESQRRRCDNGSKG